MKRKRFLLLLCTFWCSLQLFAQQISVSGTVTDSNNEPVIGASVLEKGTSNGIITDVEGNFSLKTAPNATIVISFIGYQTVEVGATDKPLRIVLKDDAELLDEVVVVGYGVQKKSVMSSAVSRVTSEELDMGNPTNVQNALKGKVSGVQITSNSGQPGADSKIRIRGTGTVNSSDPLYIIDGMPSESGINHLNPSDIESIEVLKDAASAAIYGARGANGVVLVTTKKGTKGTKATLNYEFTYGIQNPSKTADLLGSADYLMLSKEAAANAGTEFYQHGLANVNTDWEKELRNDNASIMNHKVSLSGGSENSTYYASFGYIKQEGIYAKGHSDYERYNLRLNYNTTLLDTKERNWLNKISLGAITAFSQSTQKGNTIGNSEAAGLITSINMLPPTESVYQTDPAKLAEYELAYPNRVIAPNGQVYNVIDMREISNPLAEMQVTHNQRTKPRNFSYNFNFDVDVLPGLKFKTTYAAEWVINSVKNVIPAYDLNSTSYASTSQVEDEKRESSYWQWENVLSYNKTFGKHSIGALVGTSMSSYHYENLKGTDYDLLAVDMDKAFIDIATADEASSKVSGAGSDHRIASVFGRINYNYDEKYLFEAVVRRDGSSNFGRKNQFAFFPSVSAGWVLTRENFMQDRPSWIDFAKIRFSWGQNGNENIGAFKYTSMMKKHFQTVFGGGIYTGMLPEGYANADLKWETSEQIDLGLDLRFFNSALTFSADYFVKKTKDMLLDSPIPMYTSYRNMTLNAGTVKNEGVELEASYRFRVDKVNFSLGANASYIKNTVTDQGPDRVGLDNLGGGLGGQITWRENGRPYGFFYGYVTDGVYQNQAEIDNSPHMDGAKPGDLKFKDLTGEGTLDASDRTIIGKPNPDWTYGFNLAADWNGFDLSAFFQGSIGNDIYKMYRRPNVAGANYESFWLNRWHGEGTSNSVPRVVEGDNYNYQISDFFVEDGSYLRMKVAQLGYTLPAQLTKKAGIQKLRVFLQGENLFTITGYSGYDPEVGTRNGFDGGTYPQARTFTVGANIVF